MAIEKPEKKKLSFLSVCIILAGVWILCAAAVTVYFHAVGNSLDSSVVGILFAPGIGEFGFGALIKIAKEKNDSDRAREAAEEARAEAEVARAELDELRQGLDAVRADMPKKRPQKAAKGPDINALREMLQSAQVALEGFDA